MFRAMKIRKNARAGAVADVLEKRARAYAGISEALVERARTEMIEYHERYRMEEMYCASRDLKEAASHIRRLTK